jgi:phosphatidylglycerophosphatase C
VKKGIAFFDFDGTITTKDTLLEFIKHSKGVAYFYWGFIICSPYLIAYKLKIITNQFAKEKILSFFFGKTLLSKFQYQCDEFATQILPQIIRPKALQEIEKLTQAGIKIVIVSASPENWILNWAKSIGADVIATKLKITDNSITGEIAGKNCYGKEKVTRIKENYQLDEYNETYGYGDSAGDKQMLALVTFSFMKPFR